MDDMMISDERVIDLEPTIHKEVKEMHPDKSKHTYNDPYVRTDDVEKREEIRRTLKEKEAQRHTGRTCYHK